MKLLMYKVTYYKIGAKSEDWQTALFTEKFQAEMFADDIDQCGDYDLVALNKWTWQVEIEE